MPAQVAREALGLRDDDAASLVGRRRNGGQVHRATLPPATDGTAQPGPIAAPSSCRLPSGDAPHRARRRDPVRRRRDRRDRRRGLLRWDRRRPGAAATGRRDHGHRRCDHGNRRSEAKSQHNGRCNRRVRRGRGWGSWSVPSAAACSAQQFACRLLASNSPLRFPSQGPPVAVVPIESPTGRLQAKSVIPLPCIHRLKLGILLSALLSDDSVCACDPCRCAGVATRGQR